MIRVGVIGFGLADASFTRQSSTPRRGLELAGIVQRKGDQRPQRAIRTQKIFRSIEELLADNSITLYRCRHAKRFSFCSRRAMSAGKSRCRHRQAIHAHLRRSSHTHPACPRKEASAFRVPEPSLGWRLPYWPAKFSTAANWAALVSYDANYDRYRIEPRRTVWRETADPVADSI